MDNNTSFQRLFDRYCKAYPDKKKKDLQQSCTEFWNKSKHLPNFQDFAQRLEEKEKELVRLATEKKNRNLQFFVKASKEGSSRTMEPCSSQAQEDQISETEPERVPESRLVKPGPSHTYKCHKKEELYAKLNVLNADILGLEVRLKNNVISLQQEKNLREYRKQKMEMEKELKKLVDNQLRQQQFRHEKKRKTDDILENEPDKAAKMGIHRTLGRPRRDDEEEIFKAILEIAQYGASTHDRCRFEQLRTVKTLDDLVG